MSKLFWLTKVQIARLRPYSPKSHGRTRVDDRRVLSGLFSINRNGLRGCDAPDAYGPPKMLYNRWKRWSDMGVFARIMEGLAAESMERKTIMIEVSRRTPCVRVSLGKYLKAHRTAASPRLEREARQAVRADNGWDEHEATCRHRQYRASDPVLHHRQPSQRLYRG